MSSTITASLTAKLLVSETFDGAYVSPVDATAGFGDQLGETLNLTATSSPPASKHSEFQKALTTGAATIDLTALPGKTVDETVNGTGLKVQCVKLRGLAANANKITVTFGASNPYALLGTTFTLELLPGQSMTLYLDGAAPTIGSGAKTIDLAGTGSQILECEIVMG